MIDIDTFAALADQLYEKIPRPLLEGLNGGMMIEEEACQEDPEMPDVYILGHYVEDPLGLGCYIVLYYGSFAALFADEADEVWEQELWETMLHELLHHIESRAGERGLEIFDEIELQRLREEHQSKGGDSRR